MTHRGQRSQFGQFKRKVRAYVDQRSFRDPYRNPDRGEVVSRTTRQDIYVDLGFEGIPPYWIPQSFYGDIDGLVLSGPQQERIDLYL